MRLIDADALVEYMDIRVFDLREMYGDYDHYTDGFDDALQVVVDAPTIDAVSVVRCKDCKHYVQFLRNKKECRCTIFSGCYDRPYPTEPDDFCSYGERRDDNA